jgi:hypothetical protein
MMGVGISLLASISSSPIASGNFTNIATNNAADGVYTLNGEMVEITDIIDTSATEGTPSELVANFNPATDVDSGGIISRSGGTILTLVQSLQDELFASGYTVVFDVLLGNGNFQLENLDWDGSFDGGLSLNASDSMTVYYDLFENVNSSDITNFPGDTLDTAQVHRVAMTVLDSSMSLSIDGGAVVSSPNPGFDAGTDTITFTTDDNTAVGRLRSFAFYEVVDDADLSNLSS